MLPSERFNGDSSQDGRWGPRTVPRNKLSCAEREQIVAMAARSDSAIRARIRLSLVLRRGECLTSESSVYRGLKTHDLLAHRGRATPSHRPGRSRTRCRYRVRCSVETSRVAESDSEADYYLCLLLDVFSRKAVGAEVHEQESREHSSRLIDTICHEGRREASGVLAYEITEGR